MAVRREVRILPDVAGIVICQAMKIAGTHVGKIAVYE